MLIDKIKALVKNSRRDKALLSFKYDNLAFKINIIQITIIVCSAIISLLENIKLQYKINDDYISVISIILSSYIGIILAIMRFLKWNDKNEEITKTMERFSFIINKLKKTKFSLENFYIDDNSLENWENMENIFRNETYDYLISTRETYDNIMNYKDKLYYLGIYRKKFIEYNFRKKDIENVEKYQKKYINRDDYINKGKINYERLCNDLNNKDELKINIV